MQLILIRTFFVCLFFSASLVESGLYDTQPVEVTVHALSTILYFNFICSCPLFSSCYLLKCFYKYFPMIISFLLCNWLTLNPLFRNLNYMKSVICNLQSQMFAVISGLSELWECLTVFATKVYAMSRSLLLRGVSLAYFTTGPKAI